FLPFFGGFPFGNCRGRIIKGADPGQWKHQQTRKQHRAHHAASIRTVLGGFQASSCRHSAAEREMDKTSPNAIHREQSLPEFVQVVHFLPISSAARRAPATGSEFRAK